MPDSSPTPGRVHRPPIPARPARPLGSWALLAQARRNALQIWSHAAYEADVEAASLFGLSRLLLNGRRRSTTCWWTTTRNYRAPAAHPNACCARWWANGLLLSEGEDWRLQRRTVAPAFAPRIMPMFARHIAAATESGRAR